MTWGYNMQSLKGHGQDVTAYVREPVHSVGVVKSTCTLYAAQLEYHTKLYKIDYTLRRNIRTLTSWPWLMLLHDISTQKIWYYCVTSVDVTAWHLYTKVDVTTWHLYTKVDVTAWSLHQSWCYCMTSLHQSWCYYMTSLHQSWCYCMISTPKLMLLHDISAPKLMLLHDISAPTSEDQGEVVVYRWVEWVREFITQRARQLQEGRPDTDYK